MPLTLDQTRNLELASKLAPDPDPRSVPTGRMSPSITTAINPRVSASVAVRGPAGSLSRTTQRTSSLPEKKPPPGGTTGTSIIVSSSSSSTVTSMLTSILKPTSGTSLSSAVGSSAPRKMSGSASPAKRRLAAPAHRQGLTLVHVFSST